MITLVVDFECMVPNKRKVFENLTVKEFGEKIVELSKDYVLVYDTCKNRQTASFCDMMLVAVDTRLQR